MCACVSGGDLISPGLVLLIQYIIGLFIERGGSRCFSGGTILSMKSLPERPSGRPRTRDFSQTESFQKLLRVLRDNRHSLGRVDETQLPPLL